MQALLHSMPLTLHLGHCLPMPPPETPESPVGKSASVYCGVTAPFSWALVCTRFCLCPPKSLVSPVLCKFWQLYGGVNGNLPQEDSRHTQGCCTQSPCPCSRPLLTCTVTGDTQTQLWLSLCGVSGSCYAGLVEPSEHLWLVKDLIPYMISPLLPSCCGFSFDLGCGVSFSDGIQHSPVNSCSAASYSLGVLAAPGGRRRGRGKAGSRGQRLRGPTVVGASPGTVPPTAGHPAETKFSKPAFSSM